MTMDADAAETACACCCTAPGLRSRSISIALRLAPKGLRPRTVRWDGTLGRCYTGTLLLWCYAHHVLWHASTRCLLPAPCISVPEQAATAPPPRRLRIASSPNTPCPSLVECSKHLRRRGCPGLVVPPTHARRPARLPIRRPFRNAAAPSTRVFNAVFLSLCPSAASEPAARHNVTTDGRPPSDTPSSIATRSTWRLSRALRMRHVQCRFSRRAYGRVVVLSSTGRLDVACSPSTPLLSDYQAAQHSSYWCSTAEAPCDLACRLVPETWPNDRNN